MTRRNHAGRPVSLWEGPAVVLGLLAGTAAGSARAVSRGAGETAGCRGARPARTTVGTGTSAAVAVAGAALVGAVDDHGPSTEAKGLAGHLRELRRGRLTTGTVKLVGLAVTGVVSALPTCSGTRLDRLAQAALVAGCANLVNLLDLRPGRALKAALLTALPLLATSAPHTASGGSAGCPDIASAAAAAVTGVAVAALPPDLAGRTMLGDTGANALGAALGATLAEHLGRTGRLVALAVVTTLTLASERVSFTEVIAATPALRAVDRWGGPAGRA